MLVSDVQRKLFGKQNVFIRKSLLLAASNLPHMLDYPS